MPQTQQAPQMPTEVPRQEARASSASVGPETAILPTPEAARGGSGFPRSGALCPFFNTTSENLGPSGWLAGGEVAWWPSSLGVQQGMGDSRRQWGAKGRRRNEVGRQMSTRLQRMAS